MQQSNKTILLKIFLQSLALIFPFTISSLVAQNSNGTDSVVKFSPDTTCNGFALDNKVSVINILGNKAWNKAITRSSQYPRLVLRNAANTEQLELIQHYGNPDYNTSEFRVGYVVKSDTNTRYIKTTMTGFESGKNIILGISSTEVQKKWGVKGLIMRSNNKIIVQYRIQSGGYLQRHSKTLYYATYTFIDDKLVEFSYGFDYE